MAHVHGGNATLTLPFLAWVRFSSAEEELSYAFQTKHRSVLVLHIIFMLVATLILCPCGEFRARKTRDSH